MDPETAARRWADTWSSAWPQRDVETIAALYADTAQYRSPAFREPYLGLAGVRRYLNENLGAVTAVEDGIRLNITKKQVENLPPVDTDHPS
jgi:hypothetical protein